ncbi:ABC transporter permease [Paraburkholderia sp. JPY432]|uniref:ABC transporter permease n=1 Tax=Paraburkholderia youngii TaxID=2782701 RepID=UPI0015953FAC|nr:ABC transporter permease [Paraburkholderia youngii]NVH74077.1 ABC transporter permease [Paraburkholderia youngii]
MRLAKRFIHLVAVLLVTSLVVFAMMWATPGDPVQVMLGDQRVSPEQVVALRHDMGLDLPPAARYASFVWRALHGDFGRSFFHHRAVLGVIAERLPATIELTLAAAVLALLIGIPLGLIAGVRRGSVLDRLTSVGSLVGVSIPGFWLGLMLMVVFSVTLHLFPVSGRISYDARPPEITHLLLLDSLIAGRLDAFGNALRHLALPALTLAIPMAAVLMRVTRTSVIDVMRSDYVLFAEAKGLPRRRVLLLHVLKNALAPAVGVTMLEIGALLGGNMIVETIFSWPGVGRLVVEAIFARNYPLVQAAVLLYAVTFVILNFIGDLLYGVLNPRIQS